MKKGIREDPFCVGVLGRHPGVDCGGARQQTTPSICKGEQSDRTTPSGLTGHPSEGGEFSCSLR
jgi:hypothetical protein